MKVPKIRFKGFEDSYNELLLEECLSVSNKKNNKLEFRKEDALSVSDECGVVNQINHLGRSYTGQNITNYKILNKGQIVYTKSPLKLKPFGIIKVNNGESGIVSVLYAVYDAKDGFCPDYISLYFEPYFRLNKYLLPLINKGAKNTINISDETALLGNVCLPTSTLEQQKIASYFQSLDTLIQTTSKQLTSLKQIKAASLQSMFPQEGETVPKVRFKGFEGEWDIIHLKDVASKVTEKNRGKLYKETFTNSAEFGVISQRDFFDHNISNDKNINGYYLIYPNDFVYNPRISVTAPVGPISRNLLNRIGIMSPLYFIFRVDGIDNNYLDYFFKTKLWHKYMLLNGNAGARFDRLSITDKKFLEMPIFSPRSSQEQQKIGKYFRNLDCQIALQAQRLEKLKRIKSACLDKMFV